MNCIITINDYHNTDGRMEKAELTAPAEVYGTEDDYFIVYDEQSDELRGCRTTMRITDKSCVEIIRRGAYNTELKMEKGRRNLCCYSTPMGQIMMGVYSSKVSSELRDGRLIFLDFSYTLDFNNELLSKNRIRITAEYRGIK